MTQTTTTRYDAVVLGERAGYVALAFGRGQRRNTRGVFDHDDWTTSYYRWPDEADMMHADVAREIAVEPTDVYVAPALRFSERRRKGDALPPTVCWADLDDEPTDPALFTRLDPFTVASGQPHHTHVYVPLSEPVPLSLHSRLNKALADRLGGDAKWSDESLLRLPGTYNHKTDPPGAVTEVDGWGGTVWTPSELADLLNVDIDNEHQADAAPHLASVPNTATYETPPDPLPNRVRTALEHHDTNDRSKAHARLVAACYDAGLSQGQTLTLAAGYRPSVDKYGNRVADEVTRWWGKVHANHTQPAPVVPLITDGTSAREPVTTTTVDNGAHRGQFRIAQRLVAEHGHQLRYAHGLGWHVWDSTRWAPDQDGAPMRAVADTITNALTEAFTLDEKARDALLSDIRKAESATGAEGVLRWASTMSPITLATNHLDADPYLFNTTNGTLDLRTGELRPADPNDLITKAAGCAYDPDAQSPTFAAFLERVLPDAEVRDYMQRVCGYALLGFVREHVLPICSGTGHNGKGTLLDIVRTAFGDYGKSVEPELLMETGPRHSTEQTDLRGARFVTTSETNEGRPLAAATVKRLTGGDAIRARRMRQDTIEFQPSHTLVMMTNFKPKVAGDDPAMWRRLRVIPFDVIVPESQQDHGLPEKLHADLSAVLTWCIEGYRRYCADGLTAPEAVQIRTDEYRIANDALGRFLAERTCATPHGTVSAGELFSAWSAWCAHNGETAESQVKFAEAMQRHGIVKAEGRGRRQFYRGITLYSEGDDENADS